MTPGAPLALLVLMQPPRGDHADSALVVRGALADHPAAVAFAREVKRVQARYADEVVAAFALCPFLRDAESGFGQFCVVLDPEPNLEGALETTLAAGAGVVHLVYPIVRAGAVAFERFAATLGAEVKRAVAGERPPPVLAVFHPQLSGDSSSPHRLVGLLRRAPDAFVQFVPAGLHEGGTTFAGGLGDGPSAWAAAVEDPAQKTHRRLVGGDLERLLAILADVRADRDRSYAPHLAALGLAPTL